MTSQLLAFVDKTSSQNNNDKTKSKVKLEFNYSLNVTLDDEGMFWEVG